ncbi:MAG: 23S rRNA (uracil(1939)-C(5))-methyltransferase RlmD [Lachnospiraceae bacterium]|nr:23S rRNA (uracil(1939)-C(5))-methyltransferase RlmD [Lachnospiraceae bacterium]
MDYRKNQQVTVKIEDIGINGEGIGRISGYTLFVKDAIVGDLVEASLTKVKKTYAYARLVRVIEPSKDRITPPCKIYRQCGGCQIQALSYAAQLAFKQQKVMNDLIRIGGISKEELKEIMEPIVGMSDADQSGDAGFRYRNKAQYPIGRNRDGKLIAGFYAGRTHAIMETDDCLLGPGENGEILKSVLTHMERYQIMPYDEESGTGLVRHVMIRKGFASGQIMVCLVINGRSLPESEILVENLKEIDGVCSIYLNVQQEKTNVILGEENILLWGSAWIEDMIHICDVNNGFAPTREALTYAISPLSFYQVNPKQTERMYSQALQYADLKGTETVWDLYCGIGTISLFMAKRARSVMGVEVVEQAVEDARENAARNCIENAAFLTGKAEEILPAYYAEPAGEFTHPDVIVVDPPRKGCDSKCLETMAHMKPSKIIYVSCDPATLARDVKYLSENGYRLTKARAFDNFPQTVHVETVCLLTKK